MIVTVCEFIGKCMATLLLYIPPSPIDRAVQSCWQTCSVTWICISWPRRFYLLYNSVFRLRMTLKAWELVSNFIASGCFHRVTYGYGMQNKYVNRCAQNQNQFTSLPWQCCASETLMEMRKGWLQTTCYPSNYRSPTHHNYVCWCGF